MTEVKRKCKLSMNTLQLSQQNCKGMWCLIRQARQIGSRATEPINCACGAYGDLIDRLIH